MTQGDVILWTCIRAAGNGLAMMPIFTAGLAAIPPQHASPGSSVNNIVQRMASSLGLAAMGLLATHQRNQLLADRSALISALPSLPEVQRMVAQGRSGVLGYHRLVRAQVIADAYSNMFLVAAALTVLGIGLAFFMRKPERPAAAEAPPPAEPAEQPPVGSVGPAALPDAPPVTASTRPAGAVPS
jgi:hypothetical protein